MKNFLMVLAAGLFITSTAMAAPKVVTDEFKLDISAVTDTEYNTKTEVATTAFGVIVETQGFVASLKPKYNFDTSIISNIELGLYYNIAVNDNFALTPYAEINYDKGFDRGDTIIAVKTKYKF